MTVDKRINYEMQGDEKPARNYLGKQKTVTVPVKWQSNPKAPATELAYITKAEKDLLVKKDLHGSLKNGPNTGPSGIVSLDSQGDYTRDRSPGAYDTGPAGTATGSSQQDLRNRAMNEQAMKDLLTGNVTKGQTVAKGPRTRQYSNLPEIITMPDGRTRYVGSAYKSYGQPSFFGNLFSRGAPGYRGIEGLSAFGIPTFQTKKRDDGSEYYYTEDENFGETKGALPFGIMGIIANAINKFRKPRDMSEFNKLSLTAPADQKVYIPEGMDVPMATMSDALFRGAGTIGGVPISPFPARSRVQGLEESTFPGRSRVQGLDSIRDYGVPVGDQFFPTDDRGLVAGDEFAIDRGLVAGDAYFSPSPEKKALDQIFADSIEDYDVPNNLVAEIKPNKLKQLKSLGIFKEGQKSPYTDKDEIRMMVPGLEDATDAELDQIMAGTFKV